MFGSSLGATALLTVLSAFLACTVQALPKISRVGRYLYDESGNRFYIKGIAYQEQGLANKRLSFYVHSDYP